MVKTLFSTILLAGVLGVFVMETAAKDKKPKATAVTCGSTISAPGNYFLSGNCAGAGITITASKVTLDLKRHTMTGLGSGDGISASNVSRVNIIGPGTITNFEEGVIFIQIRNCLVENVTVIGNLSGITFGDSSGSRIRKNRANDNADQGISLFGSTDNEIEENEANRNGDGIFLKGSSGNGIGENEANNNGSNGILLDDSNDNEVEENETNGNQSGIALASSNRNEIKENEANENSFIGIGLFTFLFGPSVDNEIEENTALNNTSNDLFDENLDCDNNEWEDNRFNTANQPCID